MTKKKNKGGKAKREKAQVRQEGRKMMKEMDRKLGKLSIRGLGPMTKDYAKSLMNPWKHSACIPDGTRGRGCFSTKDLLTLATGTGGSCSCVFVCPRVESYYIGNSSNTGATPTITGSWSSSGLASQIASYYSQYRPVSCGVRLTYTGDTQVDKGQILAGLVSSDLSAITFHGLTIGDAARKFKQYEIIPLRNGVELRWEPASQEEAEEWQATGNGPAGVSSSVGTVYLAVIVYGATAAVTQGIAEIIVNYEGMYKDLSFAPGGLSDASVKAEAGWYEKAIDAVRDIPNIVPVIGQALGSGIAGWARGGPTGALYGIGSSFMSRLSNGYPGPGLISSGRALTREGRQLYLT